MKVMRLLLIIVLLIGYAQYTNGQSSDKLEVRLGILHSDGNSINRLRAQDKVFAGDKLRIFIDALSDCHVYVIYSDGDEASLLFPTTPNDTAEKGRLILLPSEDEFYELTADNPNVKFTVFSSKNPLSGITEFFGNTTTKRDSDWIALEESISKEISTDLGDNTDQPFSIAAIVRGDDNVNEKFLKKLQTFTGDHSVFRSYNIKVFE